MLSRARSQKRCPRESVDVVGGNSDRGLEDLFTGCLAGDLEAWDLLIDQHYAGLGQFIARLGIDLDRGEVEECCAEVFLRAISGLPGFSGPCRGQTWLWRLAAKVVGEYENRRGLDLGAGSKSGSAGLEASWRHLGMEYREILALRYFAGLSSEEIARGLDRDRGVIEAMIEEGLRKLGRTSS